VEASNGQKSGTKEIAMKVCTMLAALTVSCWMGASVLGQDANQPTKPGTAKPTAPTAKPAAGQPSEEDMMKAWEAAGKPGPEHAQLAKAAGEWDAAVKHRMAPEAPWQESKGTETCKVMYDGRFLHQTFTGDMMGEKFTGTGVMGYNNVSKEYESIWFDSMSTAIMFMTGKADATGKTITLRGECADPMANGKKKTMRIVQTFASPDKHVCEFFEPGPDGKEFSMMTITYTRKAGGADGATKPAGSDSSIRKNN
jgi:hypothetical protein